MKNKKQLPEFNETKDNQTVVLSRNQTDPGSAKAEEFEIQSEILPGHGQCGDSYREYARLTREAESKNRESTPDRNSVNSAAKPSTGSILE
jgi:hypothetical protein